MMSHYYRTRLDGKVENMFFGTRDLMETKQTFFLTKKTDFFDPGSSDGKQKKWWPAFRPTPKPEAPTNYQPAQERVARFVRTYGGVYYIYIYIYSFTQERTNSHIFSVLIWPCYRLPVNVLRRRLFENEMKNKLRSLDEMDKQYSNNYS